ncbi:hypothetical protein V1477_020319 [Vespula maculifrons]|uniref:Uncharacterized protein n=1 Tax=Vespula maculifrons TaxID=7453 RepID=A0ABD2ALL3_VESMC
MASLRAVDVYDENVSEITSWLTKVAMVGTVLLSSCSLPTRLYVTLAERSRAPQNPLRALSGQQGTKRRLRPQTSEIITRSPLGAEGLYCPRDRNSKGRPKDSKDTGGLKKTCRRDIIYGCVECFMDDKSRAMEGKQFRRRDLSWRRCSVESHCAIVSQEYNECGLRNTAGS